MVLCAGAWPVRAQQAAPLGPNASLPAPGATVESTPAGQAEGVPGPSSNMTYIPPPCEGLFLDVPCSHPFAPWIEQLYRDRITAGCGGGEYCPDDVLTRGQAAVLLERAVHGTERWPSNTVFVWQVMDEDGSPNDVASGQALRDAIASIPTVGPMAAASFNPWVVLIGPGWFNLGDDALTVPEGINLRGVGRDSTRIKKTGDSAVTLAGSNTVSDLYLSRSGLGNGAYGFVANDYARLDNVRINVVSGGGWNIGVLVNDGVFEMRNSEIHIPFSGGLDHSIYLGPDADTVYVTSSELWGEDGAIRHATNQLRTAYLRFSTVETAPVLIGAGDYRCAYNVTIMSYTPVACP